MLLVLVAYDLHARFSPTVDAQHLHDKLARVGLSGVPPCTGAAPVVDS